MRHITNNIELTGGVKLGVDITCRSALLLDEVFYPVCICDTERNIWIPETGTCMVISKYKHTTLQCIPDDTPWDDPYFLYHRTIYPLLRRLPDRPPVTVFGYTGSYIRCHDLDNGSTYVIPGKGIATLTDGGRIVYPGIDLEASVIPTDLMKTLESCFLCTGLDTYTKYTPDDLVDLYISGNVLRREAVWRVQCLVSGYLHRTK